MPAEGTALRGTVWYYRTSERDALTGKRTLRWRRAIDDGQPNTQAGASRARRARLKLLDDGVRPTARTVRELVVAHIAQRPTLKPASRYTYANALKNGIAPHLGDLPARDLTRSMVRGWHQSLLRAGNSPATIQQYHALLSGALQTAVGDDELPRNVAALERPPRATHAPEPPAWSEQRIEHFLTLAATDTHDGALWTLLALTGLRISESVILSWEDVELSDLRTAAVTVRATGSRTDRGARMIGAPKSEAGRRRVALPLDATLALRDHRDRQAFAGASPWVFPGIQGGPMAASTARLHLHRFCRLHSLLDMTPHDLRHIQASWLLAAGANPKAILARMGWTRLALLDRYAHLVPGAADELAGTLTARLDAARASSDDTASKSAST